MAEPAIHGMSLWGEPLEPPPAKNKLSAEFLVPPFSVLNAREGWWQDRKRAWISLGIKSELGRGANELGLSSGCEEYRRSAGDYNKTAGITTRGSGSDLGVVRKIDDATTVDDKRDYAKTYNSGAPGALGAHYGRRPHSGSLDEHPGREPGTEYTGGDAWVASENGSGTSIFDPVLCELAYRWFCPPGGQVVDPFAGGSVRGIVAAMLGRRYWGCDLRAEQLAANEQQAAAICPEAVTVPVTVSGAMLRQRFHPCESNFIQGVCRGRCCEGSDGIKVAVHAGEQARIEALGAQVADGYIVADERGLCPFKSDDGFCREHGPQKPFGCQASPFTLNDTGLLIVRNRYRLLKCYDCEGAQPAYAAHRWSLGRIFGEAEADRIASLAAGGADRIDAAMPWTSYRILADNHELRNGSQVAPKRPALDWACGDARDLLPTSPPADLLFSCPPYGDLEKYSDDPRDLSAMPHAAFCEAYAEIIKASAARLKPNRFACFVVGDFRDKQGHYRDFVSLTIAAFKAAGLAYYNEAVLVTAVGSLPIRITKQFNGGRKLGKTHQNVLVFVKGDWRKAADACEQEATP